MAGRVVVFGSVNVDFVVTLARLPGPGETVSGGELQRYGGGKGANQAVAAVRAGAATAMVGCVGRDPEGDAALSELAGLGVDVAHVQRSGDAATGVALVVVDRHGMNQIAVAPGANRQLQDVPTSVLGGGPGVLLLSFEVPDPVLCAAAEAARAAGWIVVANPAPARTLPARLVATGPILVPNEHEAAELAGTHDLAAAARHLQVQTGAPVIVTLGAEGALLVDGDGPALEVPAPAVEVVDTTGAGDALCGTLAARLAVGDTPAAALRAAVIVASAAVTIHGAR